MADNFELSLPAKSVMPRLSRDTYTAIRKEIPRFRRADDEDIDKYIATVTQIDTYLSSIEPIKDLVRSLAPGRIVLDNIAKRNALLFKFADSDALLTWLRSRKESALSLAMPACQSLTWPEFTALDINVHKHKRFISQAKGNPSLVAIIVCGGEDVCSVSLIDPRWCH